MVDGDDTFHAVVWKYVATRRYRQIFTLKSIAEVVTEHQSCRQTSIGVDLVVEQDGGERSGTIDGYVDSVLSGTCISGWFHLYLSDYTLRSLSSYANNCFYEKFTLVLVCIVRRSVL